MKRFILEPLEDDHIVVKITATEIETPFAWKTSELKQEENYEWWDILHSVLLNWLLSKEKSKYVFSYYAEDMTDKQISWLRKCMRLVEEKNLPDMLMIEQKKRLKIEYGKYLIILSWKFDWLYIKDNKICLVDLKTTASKINYENKIQLKIYWYLNNIKDIEYWVFSKSAEPNLEIMPFELDLEKNKMEVLLRLVEHMEEKYWYVIPKVKDYLYKQNPHKWEYQ